MFTNRKKWIIKPEGWLKKQLEIQAAGLSGNLDKVWPDIRDSAWIGGKKEGWERVPYWLDGFIPLAYLLDDKDLISRAEKYVNAILDRQEQDGWICPCKPEERKSYDLWSLMLISKVLTLYCEFTGSSRAEDAIYRSLKNFYELLLSDKVGLGAWGKFRWYETFIALTYLYQSRKEEWILELGRFLKNNGVDYYQLKDLWTEPKNEWTFETHIVNIAMMFKYEVLTSYLLNEEYTGKAEELWQYLDKYNGTAVGSFTGDECLSGKNNNRGFELCSIVELMYSCEVLYKLTGDTVWCERLEKIAFNGLPATISEDMWTHQYDQQVNQIGCVHNERSFFRTNGGGSNLFGLEPNFGCCTANFNQGWPKLALNSFSKTEKGVECSLMLPATLETEINGVKVSVSLSTDYPFKMTAKYTVIAESPVDFELKIRIPSWTKALTVNGKKAAINDYYIINQKWLKKSEITIMLNDSPHFTERPYDLKAVEYGPLVFALPLETEYKMYEYEKDGVERKFPYCDYELYLKSEWRYGFANNNLELCEYPFESAFRTKNPPVKIKADLCRIDWDMEEEYNYIAKEKPNSNLALSKSEAFELIPYGCAKLRMTEMPMCDLQREEKH